MGQAPGGVDVDMRMMSFVVFDTAVLHTTSGVSLCGRLCFQYGVLLEGIVVLLVFDLLWIRGTVAAFKVPLWIPLSRTSIITV